MINVHKHIELLSQHTYAFTRTNTLHRRPIPIEQEMLIYYFYLLIKQLMIHMFKIYNFNHVLIQIFNG